MSGVNSEVGVQGRKFRIRKFISSEDVCKLDWVQKKGAFNVNSYPLSLCFKVCIS